MRKFLIALVAAIIAASAAPVAGGVIIGDGGGTGVLNGITCNSAHNTWTTYWNGHYYVCAWTHSSNYVGWSWVYLG